VIIPIIVLACALLMMWAEARNPGRRWPEVRGWWGRALLFNGLQAATVWGFGLLWHRFVDLTPGHELVTTLGTIGAAVVGYVVQTFIYYWWHRFRHEVPFLWRWLHQLHHSPQRLEVITSFYKHPLELLANAALSASVMYLVLGLTPDAAAGAALLGGLGELFYHWNVKTPRWVGYLVQRPEAHCVHHQEGRHSSNYGDLAIWDILFGTFENPETFDERCGFGDDEHAVGSMLAGVDVHDEDASSRHRWRALALGVLGLIAMFGHAIGSGPVKGIALATAASPAPKVFASRAGLEALSSKYTLVWEDAEGRAHRLPLTHELYPRIRGPYNRRNVYGAALAFGPVMVGDDQMRDAFEDVTRHGVCRGVLLEELGIDPATVERVWLEYDHRPETPSSVPNRLDIHCEGVR
jgi:sterol desaturase/sphingolipid hydroxylase (fatty acid hydroxylase superfamily)